MKTTIQSPSAKALALFSAALLATSPILNASVSAPSAKFCFAANSNPLCLAISRGDFEVVKKFIEYGADVNERSNGMTPLMVAARYNNVAIVALLLNNGANKDAKDDKGFTAMKHAELSNATAASEYLKSH